MVDIEKISPEVYWPTMASSFPREQLHLWTVLVVLPNSFNLKKKSPLFLWFSRCCNSLLNCKHCLSQHYLLSLHPLQSFVFIRHGFEAIHKNQLPPTLKILDINHNTNLTAIEDSALPESLLELSLLKIATTSNIQHQILPTPFHNTAAPWSTQLP